MCEDQFFMPRGIRGIDPHGRIALGRFSRGLLLRTVCFLHLLAILDLFLSSLSPLFFSLSFSRSLASYMYIFFI